MPSIALEKAQAHAAQGRLDLAEQVLRRALTRDRADPRVALVLGQLILGRGDAAQAVYHFREAAARADRAGLKGRPELAEYELELARALSANGANPEAVAALDRAANLVQSGPAAGLIQRELGAACAQAGLFDRARIALQQALLLQPQDALASCHLADLYLSLGRPEQAAAQATLTARADPTSYLHRATQAVFAVYASGFDAAQVFAEHRATAALLEQVPRPKLPEITRDLDPDRPLRVAFLSPDFRNHSVAFFIEPILEHLNRDTFKPIAVYGSSIDDDFTKRLRGRFEHWHHLSEIRETTLAELMRAERVDIAVDLAGFSVGSLAWAMRARIAPVQITYLGYPHTTGMADMDYRIVDSLTDPATPRRTQSGAREVELPSADALATEKLVRLDPCFVCYRPPDEPDIPPPDDPPSWHDGPVVFGSFNLLGKASAATKGLWAKVLAAVPASLLLLKDGVFEHPQARADFAAQMAALGVSPERLVMLPKTPTRREHLQLYARMDIALDTTPYNGTTTTCEALLMGVPVVTLAGQGHAGRVGLSLLSAVGLNECIARSGFDYVRLASDLARDLERRRELRGSLRRRLLASPLCDAPGFTRQFEAALRAMWQEWVAKPPNRQLAKGPN